ncbi:hypothetical protein WP50_11415 [Lactiplantibacillus plantarum]|nr:hypothetical protein WP50_11415 [Lactiplantibacillus plantarum]
MGLVDWYRVVSIIAHCFNHILDAYNVGIKLTSNRDPLPKLRLADVQLKKRSGIKTVIGNIQNYHASILGKGTVTAYVSKAGQTKKLAVADLKSQ